MNNTFDYERAKAYVRSGSRSDLMTGPGVWPCRMRVRVWLSVLVPALVLSLVLTIVIGRTLACDPFQPDVLLPSTAKKILEEFAGLSPRSPQEVAAGLPAEVSGELAGNTSHQPLPGETLAAVLAKDIVVKNGDTLLDILVREGLERDQAHSVVGALKPVFNPRRLQRDHALTMTYEVPDEDSFEFKSLNIKLDSEHEVQVDRCETNGFTASEIVREFETRTLWAEFEINSSLYEAAAQHGVPFEMLLPVINTYAYDVDFQRDIHAGDHFEIMYETKVNADGEALCGGTTAFAALTTQGRRLTLYHYQDSAGAVDYFDDQGRSLKKNLMITPVDGARISSGYGQRRHPILGYSKMHKGLDFAASSGSPIKAAGEGVVEFAASNGTYGNLVRLGHANNYQTKYAHMSRFARGVRPGVRVKQGQIIGYVGSTGRSTGPHLHYEVLHHGHNLNPASIKTTPGRILQGSELARFMEAKAELDVQFSSLKEPAVYAQINQPGA